MSRKAIVFLTLLILFNSSVFAAAATQNTTLNVNAIAAKVFPEGEQQYDFHFNGYYDPVSILKIKTGLKDMAGNEEVYFRLIDINQKDTFYLVPDNHIYPLFWREFHPGNPIEVDNSGYRYGADYEHARQYLMAESKMASFIWDGYSYGFVRDYDKTSADRKFLQLDLQEQHDFINAESKKLWEYLDAYYQSKLDFLNGKKYDELLAPLDGKIIHLDRRTRYGSGSAKRIDRPKVTFTKDASGNLTELILWYPFMDGKYYDKPEFKKVVTKDNTGMFYINTRDEKLTGFLDGYFLPYNSGFIIAEAPKIPDYSGYSVIQCNITGAGILNFWDVEMFNAIEDGLLFYSAEVHNLLGSAFYTDEVLAFYKDWWKTKNVTMTYEATQDMRHFYMWLPAYFEAVAKTAK